MKTTSARRLKKRSHIISTAIAGLITVAAGSVHADGFSTAYVFGDSLSDNGNLGTWTNSTSAASINVWHDFLASKLNFSMTPAWNYSNPTAPTVKTTGNNFAIGGATTADQTGTFPIKGTGGQIDALITRSGNTLDPAALYVIYIGGNDIGNAWGGWLMGGASASGVSTATAAMSAAAARVAQQVATLQAAGAKSVMVMNAPDISITPYIRDTAEGAAIQVAGAANATTVASLKAQLLGVASTLSSAYNSALSSALAGKNLLFVDANTLLTSLISDPAKYGMDPTKIPSATTNYLLQGSSATALGTLCPTSFGTPVVAPVPCTKAADGYIFSNNFHPTDTVHGIFADLVYQTLSSIGAANTGASISNMALVVPLGRSGAEWRTIDNRTRNFQNFGYSGKGARIFVAGDYADANAESPDGSKAGSGSTLTGTVGMETAIGPNTLLGGTLGVEKADLDIVNNAGRLQYREVMASLFASHKMDNWYLNGLASFGWLTFDTSRNVFLGASSSNEAARFDGTHYGVKGQLGYQIRSGSMIHGPFVGIDYEAAKVDPFSEGLSQYAISVKGQTIKQAHYRVGYEVAGETNLGSTTVRPWLVASYDNQYLEDERTVVAGLATSGAMLASTNRNQTGGFSRLGAGFSTKLAGGSDLSIGLSTSFSNPAGDDTAVNVVWNMAM